MSHAVAMVAVPRWQLWLPALAYLVGLALLIAAMTGPNRAHPLADAAIAVAMSVPSIVLGGLLIARRPASSVGPALVAAGASPTLTYGVESWGGTFGTAMPWPGAQIGAAIQPGIWVLNFAGFVLLCVVFPDGALPGRRWQILLWAFGAAAVLIVVSTALDPQLYATRGGELPGNVPVQVPEPLRITGMVLGLLLLLLVLLGSVARLSVRYTHGGERVRLQLRWLLLGATTVPAMLVGAWLATLWEVPVSTVGNGIVFAILIVIPAAVTIAVLRHDLLDIERLLSSTAAWLLTSLSVGVGFAAIALGLVELAGQSERVSITGAAFVVALVLVPVQRRLHELVGRVLDRERTVMVAGMREFVHQVRDGTAEPEQVQDTLRRLLRDPGLQVLITMPGSGGYVDLSGRAQHVTGTDAAEIPIRSGESRLGLVVLGRPSARRLRSARQLIVQGRLPIEVSRLRLELRAALTDVQASRSRLVEAVTAERRQLERDLHDGAQQQILAVGMRLRSIQRHLDPGRGEHRELDDAVAELEAVVAELRRLAHGIRPSRLDDGLAAAVGALIAHSPIPVETQIADIPIGESVATTVYFVVAEGLANTLKHANATRARVTVALGNGALQVELCDDGCGGAHGLTALRDRVTAVGGRFEVTSPIGSGTTIRAEF